MFYLCYLYLFVWLCPVRFPYHMMFVSFNSRQTGVRCGTGTANPSGVPEFIPGFSGVRVTRCLVLWIVVFFLVLFLLTILMLILLRFTASDYYFGIFILLSMVLSGQYIRYCIDLSAHDTLNCTTHTLFRTDVK